MKLLERVSHEIEQAMRSRETTALGALRLLKAALVNRRVESAHELSDAEERLVVASLVKQRRDSIAQFTKAGRQDLVDQEARELEVLAAYLPPPLSSDELRETVRAAIDDAGAREARDFGRVMKVLMPRLADRGVDGAQIRELVRQELSGGH